VITGNSITRDSPVIFYWTISVGGAQHIALCGHTVFVPAVRVKLRRAQWIAVPQDGLYRASVASDRILLGRATI
jgi:hypothetical protein